MNKRMVEARLLGRFVW